MADDKALKAKIAELESEIARKSREALIYKEELSKVNSVLEKLIMEMSGELKLAGLVQKKLAPTEIPHITGIEFSTKFVPGVKSGGDYLDIFELEDRMRFAVLVASCSGYAMSALLLSVLIKNAGHIEAKKGMDPDKVILTIAGELLPGIIGDETASLFYAVVDRRTFEMKYSCVGNIATFLQPHQSDKVSFLEPGCGPLRKGFNEKPMNDVIVLGPRDRLIVCTEGVTQASDSRGEQLGRDGLLRAIQKAPRSGVHELRNEILYQTEKFTGKSEPSRDQTVLVTEVKDKVIKLAKKAQL